jgi:serine protease AprX
VSGTAMAPAITAGLVALLLEQEPKLTPAMVRERLLAGAGEWGLPSNGQGAGDLGGDQTGVDAE